MFSERLADLDELVLRCRDDQGREYIREAVACYTAGAFRSCIVATWIAIVYDYLHKLRELELSGDAQAARELKEFHAARESGDLRKSLNFERTILDVAKDKFELISPLEHLDLTRLRDDRNRCAHPSMNSEDEVFQPSPELARYHLRTAVTSLLQHQPVQGKAALGQILQDVDSMYFPESEPEVIERFGHGPLARPRPALVHSVLDLLVKQLLQEEYTDREWNQRVAAVKALRQMHRNVAEKHLAKKLPSIVRTLPDIGLLSLLRLVSDIPDSWQFLDIAMQGRLEQYVRNMPQEDLRRGLAAAARIPEFEPHVEETVRYLSSSQLSAVIDAAPSRVLVGRAIELYAQSTNYQEANSIGRKVIEPLLEHMSPDEVDQLCQTASANSQIGGSHVWTRQIIGNLGKIAIGHPEVGEVLTRYGLKEDENESLDDIPF